MRSVIAWPVNNKLLLNFCLIVFPCISTFTDESYIPVMTNYRQILVQIRESDSTVIVVLLSIRSILLTLVKCSTNTFYESCLNNEFNKILFDTKD